MRARVKVLIFVLSFITLISLATVWAMLALLSHYAEAQMQKHIVEISVSIDYYADAGPQVGYKSIAKGLSSSVGELCNGLLRNWNASWMRCYLYQNGGHVVHLYSDETDAHAYVPAIILSRDQYWRYEITPVRD